MRINASWEEHHLKWNWREKIGGGERGRERGREGGKRREGGKEGEREGGKEGGRERGERRRRLYIPHRHIRHRVD